MRFSGRLTTNGAHDGTRIRDLFLTKEVLYRLSYMGLDVGRGRSM